MFGYYNLLDLIILLTSKRRRTQTKLELATIDTKTVLRKTAIQMITR